MVNVTMDSWSCAMLIMLWLILIVMEITKRRHCGSNKQTGFIDTLLDDWNRMGFFDWGARYKEKLAKLKKNEFVEMRSKGMLDQKREPWMASRGYMKLNDILNQTKLKLSGTILSLASGRGGWDQLISPFPSVKRIISITFGPSLGHAGHEEYSTKNWPCKEKVQQIYADITKIRFQQCDWVLFDGGESHTDSAKEADTFLSLFTDGPYRAVMEGDVKGFILKVLTPTDLRLMNLLHNIQEKTGLGAFRRSIISRNTTLELYFVSLPRENLKVSAGTLLRDTFIRAAADYVPDAEAYTRVFEWPSIRHGPWLAQALPVPDYTQVFKALGSRVAEAGRTFSQWKSLGIYPFGVKGTSNSKRVGFISWAIAGLEAAMPEIGSWNLTDTTPEGFMGVFRKKVDTAPKIDHKYREARHFIYQWLAQYYKSKGFEHTPLTSEEIVAQANHQGATTILDYGTDNLGHYLSTVDWRHEIEQDRKELLDGKPSRAVFFTMGKREKKQGKKGSRMIAFMNASMRLLELETFGRLIGVTKPDINPAGVGGVGLHDLGELLKRRWKGYGISMDTAGFDTRVSAADQEEECEFICALIPDGYSQGKEFKAIIRALYSVYANPLILIPLPGDYVRSELLQGFGQRMSGSNPTYSMNTITNIVNMLLMIMEALGHDLTRMAEMSPEEMQMISTTLHDILDGEEWGLAASGDDGVISTTRKHISNLANNGRLCTEIGYPRKDLPVDAPTPKAYALEEITFCSHSYQKVTFFDAGTGQKTERYMPTRPTSEIVGKCALWAGATSGMDSEEAWVAAQANQLLVCYPHMRTCRLLGLGLKGLVRENIILTDKGVRFLPKPWLRQGDVLGILNDVLFGGSTMFPIPGFSVKKFSDVGYIRPKAEAAFTPPFYDTLMKEWRATFPGRVYKKSQQKGLNSSWIMEWTIFKKRWAEKSYFL